MLSGVQRGNLQAHYRGRSCRGSFAGVSAARLSLAWLYQQAQRWQVAALRIPGTRRRHRLEENVGVLAVTLSPAEMPLLDRLAAAVTGVAT